MDTVETLKKQKTPYFAPEVLSQHRKSHQNKSWPLVSELQEEHRSLYQSVKNQDLLIDTLKVRFQRMKVGLTTLRDKFEDYKERREQEDMLSSGSFIQFSSAGFSNKGKPKEEETCEQHEQRIKATAVKIRERETQFKTTAEPLRAKISKLKLDVKKESDKCRSLKVTLRTLVKIQQSPDRRHTLLQDRLAFHKKTQQKLNEELALLRKQQERQSKDLVQRHNPADNQFQVKISRLESDLKYSKEQQQSLREKHRQLPMPEIETTD